MEWKRLTPIAILVLLVAFVGLGLVYLVDPQIEIGCYDPSVASRHLARALSSAGSASPGWRSWLG
jgi:hypothetical protein